MDPEPIDPVVAGDADMGIDYTEGEDEVIMSADGTGGVFDGGDAVMGEGDYTGFEDEADMREWDEIGVVDGVPPHSENGNANGFAQGVAIVTGALPPTDTSPTTSSEAPRPPHPGFASPPAVITSDSGLQVSALGHSAADDYLTNPLPFSHVPSQPILPGVSAPVSPPPRHASQSVVSQGTPTDEGPGSMNNIQSRPEGQATKLGSVDAIPDDAPQSHGRHDLNGRNALAAQHQKSEDGKQTQEQSVESRGPGEIRVHQSQSQERASDEEDVTQENEVTIRQRKNSIPGERDHLDVDMDQINRGGRHHEGTPVNQINHVKVFKREDDCASGTLSGGTVVRPEINKRPLTAVDLSSLTAPELDPDEEELDREEAQVLAAPPVLLTVGNETYTLFRTMSEQSEQGGDDPSSAMKLIFGERKEHELYYDQIESLFEALHDALPELKSREKELILSFDAIGISLPEDNVYTREVNLYDFDRIHVGCELPGRLHVRVEQQQRFSSGFNALAQHIANSFNPEDENVEDYGLEPDQDNVKVENEEIDEEAAFVKEDAGDEEGEAEGANDAADVEGGVEVEGVDETFDDGEWFDAAGGEEEADEHGEEHLAGDIEGEEEDEPPLTGGEALDAEEGDGVLGAGESIDEVRERAGDEGLEEDGDLELPGDDPESAFVDAEFHLNDEEEKESTSLPSTVLSSVSSGLPLHNPSGSGTSSTSESPSIPTQGAEAGQSFEATKSVGAVDDAPDADELDSAAADVVIDYEEAFDPVSSHPSPLPAVMVPVPADEETSPNAKRTHDSLSEIGEVASDALVSGDPKRARLSDPDGEPPAPSS